MARNKMKNIDIMLDGLKECWPGFDMTRNDIINPTLNSVIKFYERFMHEFGIMINTIISLFNQDTEYEDIMYVYILYSCADHLYQQLELSNSFALSFTNFINPTDDKNLMGRTKMLANFLYYVKLTLEDPILSIREKVLEEIAAADGLWKKEKNINEELKTAAFTQANNLVKLDILKLNNNILRKRLIETQLESQELNKTVENLKTKLKLDEDDNARLTEKIEERMSKTANLKSLVIYNHEAIIEEKNKIEKEITEEEIQSSDHMKNVELKTADESNVIKVYEIINNLIENVNLPKLLDMYSLIEENKKEKEKLIKEIQASQKTENEESNLNDQLNHALKEMEEKFQALNLQSNIRLQTLENEKNQLNKEFTEISNQFKKSIEDAAELNKSLKYIRDCNSEYSQKIGEQYKFYESCYASILNAKKSVDKKVVDVIDLIKLKGAAVAKFGEDNDGNKNA